MKKTLINIIFLITLSSCHKYSEIETTITCTSYTRQLYTIDCYIIVRDWNRMYLTTEYYKTIENVYISKVDSVVKIINLRAVDIKKRVDKSLKCEKKFNY